MRPGSERGQLEPQTQRERGGEPEPPVSRSRRAALLALGGGALLATGALLLHRLRVPARGPEEDSVLQGDTARLLLVGDPFALALREAAPELGRLAGGRLEVELVGYDDVRRLTLRNAQDQVSAYDLVSFDVVWAAEYGEQRLLLPLEEHVERSRGLVEPEDFLDMAWAQSRHGAHQLGLPIQPHPELLWYRRDLFARAGLRPPTTTEELLQAARRLHEPRAGMSGVLWNGQRGQAFGQQMAHFYAAFGQPLLGSEGRPTLDTPRGVAAARFARQLLEVSPPDVINTAWDQRPRRMAQGRVAMTYEWGARAWLVEEEPSSLVAGRVGYTAAPHAPGEAPVTPLGTWSLGIPANIGPRLERAWGLLAWLTSRPRLALLAHGGNGGMPRKSLLRDTKLRRRYPVFAVVEELGRRGELRDWMRPRVPQWPRLAEILGTTYHDMLLGQLTAEQAAARAQQQAEELFALGTAPER